MLHILRMPSTSRAQEKYREFQSQQQQPGKGANTELSRDTNWMVGSTESPNNPED